MARTTWRGRDGGASSGGSDAERDDAKRSQTIVRERRFSYWRPSETHGPVEVSRMPDLVGTTWREDNSAVPAVAGPTRKEAALEGVEQLFKSDD